MGYLLEWVLDIPVNQAKANTDSCQKDGESKLNKTTVQLIGTDT